MRRRRHALDTAAAAWRAKRALFDGPSADPAHCNRGRLPAAARCLVDALLPLLPCRRLALISLAHTAPASEPRAATQSAAASVTICCLPTFPPPLAMRTWLLLQPTTRYFFPQRPVAQLPSPRYGCGARPLIPCLRLSTSLPLPPILSPCCPLYELVPWGATRAEPAPLLAPCSPPMHC